MSLFKEPGVRERQSTSLEVKKAMLEKFRASMNDPALLEKQAERAAIIEARNKRQAERDAQKEAEKLVAAEKARIEALAAAEAAVTAEEGK